MLHPEWSYQAVIYEMNVRQLTREGTLRAAAAKLGFLRDMGIDAVWLMPVYPIGAEGRKGSLGSYYSIRDYCAVDPGLGTMGDFDAFVAEAHRLGMKVLLDWVANHTARDARWVGEKPADWYERDAAGAPAVPWDWTDTAKLNYANRDVWRAEADAMEFWVRRHAVDGFRCDMAEMVPVEFWEWAIPQVKEVYPEILFIAEVYNPGEYRSYLFRGKFDYLYDKVGLYDTLRAVTCGYESATAITRSWQSLGGIEKRMLNFLENHDEQRIASDFFASNPRKAIPALIVSACMNTNPMMIYFGQEFGELGMDSEGFSGRDGRTTIFDYWSVDTIRRWRNGGKFDGKMLTEDQKHLYSIYKRLLTLCNEEKAISQGAFFDLMYANVNGWRFNEHKQYTFLRKFERDLLLFVVNFDHISADLAINIPSHAFDFLQIPQMDQYKATELLSGKEENISLLPYKATNVAVEGYGGKILKIKL